MDTLSKATDAMTLARRLALGCGGLFAGALPGAMMAVQQMRSVPLSLDTANLIALLLSSSGLVGCIACSVIHRDIR